MMHPGAIAISAGDLYSMILKKDGSVWATGDNEDSQLGGGLTREDKLDFVMVVKSGESTLY